MLQLKAPALMHSRGLDYGSGTVLLPTRLLPSDCPHPIDLKSTKDSRQPSWKRLLDRYVAAPEQDHLLERSAVHDTHLLPHLGHTLAVNIRVSDIWRILASFKQHMTSGTVRSNTDTTVYVNDISFTIPCSWHGLPVVRADFEEDERLFRFYATAAIPAERLAQAICGINGLPTSTFEGCPVFASSVEGWSELRLPAALAFCAPPLEHLLLFESQTRWCKQYATSKLKVCQHLWEHADAIDCTAVDGGGKPVKILLRQVQESALGTPTTDYHFSALHDLFRTQFTGDDWSACETEDAYTLLLRSVGHEAREYATTDEDGRSGVVDAWFGLFGPQRARWLALWMLGNLQRNLCAGFALPWSFEALLEAPSGRCFVV